MKAELSEKALKLVGNANVLVNLISRRVRQLNSGGNKPLILETAGLSTADIALTEIVEGKMKWETDLPKPKRKSRRRVRKACSQQNDLPSARGHAPLAVFFDGNHPQQLESPPRVSY